MEGGAKTCTGCGRVVDEGNNMVSEVGFVEGSNGRMGVQGQFVSASGSMRFRSNASGYNRNSREQTVQQATNRLQELASKLKLGNSHVEQASRLYSLALSHNFTTGRKKEHVAAACLYIICRRDKTPHMLLDFADATQINVYTLGHTYLQFCHLLNMELPVMDPCFYVHRFCARLNFEDKTQAVVQSSLRIVQRMKRDWLQIGRRPAGICGAAILIAARMHGFHRTNEQILGVIRMSSTTLKKRLAEIEATPTSELTAAEFGTVDLEEEMDPPCYTDGLRRDEINAARKKKREEREKKRAEKEEKKKKKRKLKQRNEGEEEVEENEEANIEDQNIEEALRIGAIQAELDETLESAAFQALEEELRPNSSSTQSQVASQALVGSQVVNQEQEDVEDDPLRIKKGFDGDTNGPVDKTPTNGDKDLDADQDQEENEDGEIVTKIHGDSDEEETLVDFGEKMARPRNSEKEVEEVEKEPEIPDEPEVFDDVDDDDLEKYFATEEEAEMRAVVWEDLNQDYILEQAEKAKLMGDKPAAPKVFQEYGCQVENIFQVGKTKSSWIKYCEQKGINFFNLNSS
eukprot:TRINITY_DN366_c0_g1_i2.p1 TRINITY_DN366_c0_g1~~TRINITY_DN366_c0_g1_i2.p1  ORF type:complete len:592 (-),score=204.29 TRINITY_DN366_c0_g1_i2:2-1723(-)